ncbi:Der f Mal f 6 allergen [Kickxella alabastrina]|uniref:Der f Mal f 6 allergen n=1 Tax=Kickxella alabastrina TaxID=61397 RepID=UPI002220CC49|nr:Der f Mal f 6 allergen [Kickxella alabastrina]KAI7834782.1 Der f Mal f 6 allergen [Kickxella alabastrina]KAJ1947484.1 hypothetical protein GGF37_000424 [Kickxella alabastrina]
MVALKNSSVSLPKVFMDIAVDGRPGGRIELELRSDVVPKTAESFRALCTGKEGVGYKGSSFTHVIPRLLAQGGDVALNSRASEKYNFNKRFEVENFKLKHRGPGTLSMVNDDSNTSRTKFFITMGETPWLDDKHVVFGRVTGGMDIVKRMGAYGCRSGNPKIITISNCGELG